MRRLLPLFLLAPAFAVGCGDAHEQTRMEITMPLQLPIANCPERSNLGGDLRAVLEVGGHDPCNLDVNASARTVSGRCDGITIGIVRPLGLGYWLQDPGSSELAPLAFIVGFVDLNKEGLDPGTSSVAVDLSGDGTTSVWLYTDAELSTWPDKDELNPESDDDAYNLFEAKRWARFELSERLLTFDRNTSDTTSNLEEACTGTLF